MEMEKDKQQKSKKQPVASSQDSVDELISKAFSYLSRANQLYCQAKTGKEPEIFNDSEYEQAQKLYIQAHDLFFQAGNKGNRDAHRMAYITYERKIVPIERIKYDINPTYSTAPAWIKTVKNHESININQVELDNIPAKWLEAFDNKDLNPKELITWQQALDEIKNKKMPQQKPHKKDEKK